MITVAETQNHPLESGPVSGLQIGLRVRSEAFAECFGLPFKTQQDYQWSFSLQQAVAQGDPAILQSEYPLQTQDEIRESFGNDFAAGVLALEPGQWEGPIKSSYGFHLVRVLQRAPSRVPELAEVRQQVTNDFKNRRLQLASDSYYEKLRQRYRVDVEGVALLKATGGNQP